MRKLKDAGIIPRVAPAWNDNPLHWGDADVFIHCAGLVGGIKMNQDRPAELMKANLEVLIDYLDHCAQVGIKRFINLGSTCAYPEMQFHAGTLDVDDLWNGRPEESNAPYGIAKRVGMEIVNAYGKQYGMSTLNLILANVYGPGAKTGPEAHVIPALVDRFIDAKEKGLDSVEVWGTGDAEREFLYVDDAADAIIKLGLEKKAEGTVNVGSSEVVSIRVLASMIRDAVRFPGGIRWDTTKPDSKSRRFLSSDKARAFGWAPSVLLTEGLAHTVEAMARVPVS
jgi:GDP-L-fucose synthase